MHRKDITTSATGAVLHGVVLSVLCVVSYWLITQILAHVFYVSRDDNLLGGMWAVVATVFVYRFGYDQTIAAALSRIAATLLSFGLCFLYLLVFPSNVWGMATLIGIGSVVMAWIGRRDDVITTGITTAVVMVVAAISPDHAWKQPILRVVDTIVGTALVRIGKKSQRRQSTILLASMRSFFFLEAAMARSMSGCATLAVAACGFR
jgi:Fusaric acid resistance protein-like